VPLGQEAASDELRLELKTLLGRVAISREVRIEPRIGNQSASEVDLLVTLSGDDLDISCIIEVKANWYPSLVKRVRTQPADRYLRGPEGNAGLFVVLWFAGDTWCNDDPRRPKALKDLAGLKRRLATTTAGVVSGYVDFLVIDCTLEQHQRAPGVAVSTETQLRAFDDPRTRSALRVYRLRCARAAALGFTGLVVATVVIGAAPGDDPKGLGGMVALIAIVCGGQAFTVGLWTLLRSLRMSVVLKRQAWTERRATYRIAPFGGNGQPALLVKADWYGSEAVCSVSATVWRYRQLEQGDDIALLVAGDPRRWAVVSQPDVHVLLVVKRPWMPFWSRKLRRYATRE
jgi:hypothetical protein